MAWPLHPLPATREPESGLTGDAADWSQTSRYALSSLRRRFFLGDGKSVMGKRAFPCTSLALLAVLGPCIGRADGSDPVLSALAGTEPLVDIRLRWESVDQTGLDKQADALTLRSRLGFQTGRIADTSLLAEAGLNWPWVDHYNSTVNGKTAYPTIPDPQYYGLNRLQLTNTSLPDTTVSVGRQRINLDDQRFVGNSGWRQNEQTFDSARLLNTSVPGLSVDLTYINRVNRVFGPDSPVGRYTGNSYLVNLGLDTPLGKLTGFDYLLSFDQAKTDSSQTVGIRLAGERPVGPLQIAYDFSYARQHEYSRNPLRYRDDYYIGELTGTFHQLALGGGVEALGGDGVKGFATPLATYHRWDGWDDKFLTTPVNGLKREYVTLGVLARAVAGLDTLGLTATYDDFSAARLGQRYGSEVDLQLQGKWRRFMGLVKLADYAADKYATTTRKVWFELDYIW